MDDITQSDPKGLETKSLHVLGQHTMDVLAQKDEQREEFPPALMFFSDLDEFEVPHTAEEGSSSLILAMQVSSIITVTGIPEPSQDNTHKYVAQHL